MAERSLESLVDNLHRAAADRDSDLADGELLRRFVQARDPAAFELIVWRHGAMVQSVCRRILGRSGESDDAFQATFLVLLKKANRVYCDRSLAGWLYGVAFRVAQRCRRATMTRRHHESRAGRPEAQFPRQSDLTDVGPILHSEINRLPERLRKPIVLCLVEGRTNEEAARILQVPHGTVLSRLSRARERLRRRLTHRGVAIGSAGFTTALAAEPVSAELINSTIRNSQLFASGTLLSGPVAAVAHGAIQTMFWNKFKLVSVVVIAAALVGGAGTTIAWRLRSKTESDKSSTISGLSPTGNTLVGADGKDEGPTAAQFELLKHEIEEARKDRDREEYHRQIAQAQDDWQKGSIEEAKQLLANCSPKFRDWEWHYLQRSLANPMPSKEPIVFKSGLKRLGDMAISPNQKWIAQGHNTYERDRDDIGLRTWDINNGKEVVLATLKEPYWVGCVAFGPRGERIAIGNAEEIEIWDTATKTRVAKITSKGWPRSLSFSPDGKRLAAAFSRIAPNDISTPLDPDVWDIATGKSVFVLPCQGKSVYSIEFSPDGLWIATGADDSTSKIWDAKTGKEQFALKCPDALTAVAFSPDSLQLATVCGMRTGLQHEMTVWHVATGMPVYSIRNEHLYWGSVAWSPNGRRLAVGGMGNGVKLIDAISGQVILTIPSKFQAFSLLFTPDGNRLYVADANRYEPSIYYWDATPLPK